MRYKPARQEDGTESAPSQRDLKDEKIGSDEEKKKTFARPSSLNVGKKKKDSSRRPPCLHDMRSGTQTQIKPRHNPRGETNKRRSLGTIVWKA